MLFDRRMWLAIAMLGIAIMPLGSARAEEGYQVIDGTRVYTVIDRSRGVATFSNACGSQTLTQRQLQAGAKPTNIIPCPRSGGGGGVSCPAGKQPTGDGRCMKKGHKDCGGGKSCPINSICLKGGCLDWSDKRVCSDLKTYCINANEECRAGNRCVNPDVETAAEAFNEGKRALDAKQYEDASRAFNKAGTYFRSANDNKNAEASEYNEDLAYCLGRAEKNAKSAIDLRILAFNPSCQKFTDFVAELNRKAAALDRARATQPASPASPGSPGSQGNQSLPSIRVIDKPASGNCPSGYVIARNMRDKCVRKGTAECYYAPISCPQISGGCCFNTHNPPPDHVNGHFCCGVGKQCVNDEGPDRGVCK